MALEGDSGEYEYLTEAVELSKDVEGMCIEIGCRRGLGIFTIMQAIQQYCPDKMAVSVDPYGSIPYIGREADGPIRLDYTNQMKYECMRDLYTWICDNPIGIVNYRFECLTDVAFFEKYKDGVPMYDLEETVLNKYSVVHFDGPHWVKGIKREIDFFNPRTPIGGIWCFDDCTIDFYDHSVIDRYVLDMGWELVKMGSKKALYKKVSTLSYEKILNTIQKGLLPNKTDLFYELLDAYLNALRYDEFYAHDTIDDTKKEWENKFKSL